MSSPQTRGDTVFLVIELADIPAGSKGTVLHAGPTGEHHIAFPIENGLCKLMLLKESLLLSPPAFVIQLLETIQQATASLDVHQLSVAQLREYLSKHGVFPICAQTVCALLVSQRERISQLQWYELIRAFYLAP
jgi:hypothetical protein